jgi:TetR/AcrR family transcriptional repressor of nem operon
VNIKHDKAKVVSTGVGLFRKKGYSNLGVAEICKTTGMAKGAFYNAFESKENYLLSCMKSYASMNTNYLISLLESNKGSAIEGITNMYVTMINNQPKDDFMGCLTNNMMSEIGTLNETICNATNEAFESLLKVIEPAVKQAQSEGDIAITLNSSETTELLHSSFFGIITRAKSTKDCKKAIASITLLIKSLKTT